MPAYAGLFHVYSCPHCKAELKQQLVLTPEPIPVKAEGHEGCSECAFGDVHCFACDDSLCPKHVRTMEKYAGYFSTELGSDLRARYGGQLYCPLCFQAAIKRFSLEGKDTGPAKPSVFNWPIILGLLSFLVIVLIGLDRCDNAKALKKVSSHERNVEAEP